MVLLIALGLLAGCGAKNTPTEAVETVLQSYQESPSQLTRRLYGKEYVGDQHNEMIDKYWVVMEDMLGEFEYEVTGEKDMSDYAGQKRKAVTVKIKGYEIGPAVREYNEHLLEEGMRRLMARGYTTDEVNRMSLEEQEKLADELRFEYFCEVMDACRAKGKTYETEGELAASYYSNTKEWTHSTLLDWKEDLDLLGDELYTASLEKAKE